MPKFIEYMAVREVEVVKKSEKVTIKLPAYLKERVFGGVGEYNYLVIREDWSTVEINVDRNKPNNVFCTFVDFYTSNNDLKRFNLSASREECLRLITEFTQSLEI